VHVGPKRLPFFKVGKELRERVNGKWKRVVKPAEPSQSANRSEPARTPSDAVARSATPAVKPHVPRRRDENLSEDII